MDDHGIESFMETEKNMVPFVLSMRAQANRQRRAMVYSVNIDEGVEGRINYLLNKEQYKKAMILISQQKSFGVEPSMVEKCMELMVDTYKEGLD